MQTKELVAKLRAHKAFDNCEKMLALYFAEYFERYDFSDYEQNGSSYDIRPEKLSQFIYDACYMLATSESEWVKSYRDNPVIDVPLTRLPEMTDPPSLHATFFVGVIFQDVCEMDRGEYTHATSRLCAELAALEQGIARFLRAVYIDGGMNEMIGTCRGRSGEFMHTKLLSYRMAGSLMFTFKRTSDPDDEKFLTIIMDDTPNPIGAGVHVVNATLIECLTMLDEVEDGWRRSAGMHSEVFPSSHWVGII